jgi:hypothetical protein
MMVAENYKYIYTIVISTGRQTGVVIPYRVRTVHRDPTGPDGTVLPYHLWAYTKRRAVLL